MHQIFTTHHSNFTSLTAAVVGVIVGLNMSLISSSCWAFQANPDQTADAPLQRPEIEQRQQKLMDDYQLLEEKLFTLYQYEKDKNPTRSKLLEKAYQSSQQSATIKGLEQAVGLLSEAKLKQAEAEQAKSLNDLSQLLALLQSEDRGKRIADELERYQEYLKEVERLLRIQKGLRGQTEGSGDEQKIAQSEAKAAQRAQKLADEIKRNEEEPTPDLIEDVDSDDRQENDDSREANEKGESRPSDGTGEKSESSDSPKSKEQDGEKGPSEQSDGQASSDQKSDPQEGEPKSADSKPEDANASPSDQSSSQAINLMVNPAKVGLLKENQNHQMALINKGPPHLKIQFEKESQTRKTACGMLSKSFSRTNETKRWMRCGLRRKKLQKQKSN